MLLILCPLHYIIHTLPHHRQAHILLTFPWPSWNSLFVSRTSRWLATLWRSNIVYSVWTLQLHTTRFCSRTSLGTHRRGSRTWGVTPWSSPRPRYTRQNLPWAREHSRPTSDKLLLSPPDPTFGYRNFATCTKHILLLSSFCFVVLQNDRQGITTPYVSECSSQRTMNHIDDKSAKNWTQFAIYTLWGGKTTHKLDETTVTTALVKCHFRT